MLRKVIIDIAISNDEYRKLYAGVTHNAKVTARDGRVIQFPAAILRSFLTHTGIQGSFLIYFDENNKFVGIHRLNT